MAANKRPDPGIFELDLHGIYIKNDFFYTITNADLDRMFCEVDLGQLKPSNTIHNHALLLESLVPLSASVSFSTQTCRKVYLA